MRVLLTALLGLLLAACTIPGPSMPAVTPSILTGTPAPTAPTATPSASSSVAAELDTCLPDPGPLPSGLQGDPCPSAITAVRSLVSRLIGHLTEPMVAPFGVSIAGIYVAPGTFDCGQLWPGVGTAILCPGVYTMPGTAMHGWVSFVGSAKVAAVALYRTLPQKLATSAPPPPWQATFAAFEVPPAGWVMP